MTTFAQPHSDRLLAQLAARVSSAWSSYGDELRTLEGRAYDDAEPAARDQLQAALREIEARRAALAYGGRAR